MLGMISFSAISQKRSLPHTKITGDDGLSQANVNSSKEITVTDSPNLGGSSLVVNLTTTAVELKVGVNAKVNRKYILMEATSNNVLWGFTANCIFSLKKNAFFMLPVGQNTTVFIKSSVGAATIAIGEI